MIWELQLWAEQQALSGVNSLKRPSAYSTFWGISRTLLDPMGPLMPLNCFFFYDAFFFLCAQVRKVPGGADTGYVASACFQRVALWCFWRKRPKNISNNSDIRPFGRWILWVSQFERPRKRIDGVSWIQRPGSSWAMTGILFSTLPFPYANVSRFRMRRVQYVGLLWSFLGFVCAEDCSVSASMLQRHFEAASQAKAPALEDGLADQDMRKVSHEKLAFEHELHDLYMAQLALEKSFAHQEPTAPETETGLNLPIADAVEANESTVEAINNLTDWSAEKKKEIQDFVDNHTFDKMVFYWFGPFGAYKCTNATFTLSDAQLCGYFSGWLNYEVVWSIILIPCAVIIFYIYFILDLVLIDTSSPDFDDEAFQRQHGWSLVRHQWELEYLFGMIVLPVQLVMLWQLGLLQVLLQALEPYFVAALIIGTGLAPVIITFYAQISRRVHNVYARFEQMEEMLSALTHVIVGGLEGFKDSFKKVGTKKVGTSLGATPKSADDSPAAEGHASRGACCWGAAQEFLRFGQNDRNFHSGWRLKSFDIAETCEKLTFRLTHLTRFVFQLKDLDHLTIRVLEFLGPRPFFLAKISRAL